MKDSTQQKPTKKRGQAEPQLEGHAEQPKKELVTKAAVVSDLDVQTRILTNKISVLNGLNKLLKFDLGSKASRDAKVQSTINNLFQIWLTTSINSILAPTNGAEQLFTSAEVTALKALVLSVQQRVATTKPALQAAPVTPVAAPLKPRKEGPDVNAYVKANEQFLLELKKMDLLYDPDK